MTRALIRLALAIAPQAFRQEYGAEIEADVLAHPRLRAILDVVVTGLMMRLEGRSAVPAMQTLHIDFKETSRHE